MRLIIILILSVTVLSGCSAYKVWYGSDKPMMSFVIVDGDGNVQHGLDKHGNQIQMQMPESNAVQGYIITWSPEYNGAFVTSTGKGCIQPAMYATSASGEAAIPTEIFTKGAAGSLSGKYAEALDKLITVTDQSTFLSIGMYGICQLSAAGGLSQSDTANLVKLLFEKASKVPAEDSQEEQVTNEVSASSDT